MAEIFSTNQIDQILFQARGHWESYIFCRLLWETGGRIAEIMLITPQDIIRESNCLRIKTLRRSVEQHRIISISKEFVDELDEFIKMRGIGHDEPIIRFSTRTALKYFKAVCDAANIDEKDACPKKIRHTRAVYLIQQGYRIDHIAENMGNRDIRRMIQYYLDPFRANLEKSY